MATAVGVVASIGIAITATSATVVTALPPTATYRDDFASSAYNLNTGTSTFAGDWTEANDSGGATGGAIEILGGGLLEFDDIASNATLTRLVDLSAHVSTNVVLTIGWAAESGSDDQLGVELRNSGGTWQEVAVLDNDATEHPVLPYTVSLQLTPSQISNQSGIRFDSSSSDWEADDEFRIEFVEFAAGTIAPNPDLPVSCGINVTIVLDESGSIRDAAGGIEATENAVRALVDGLKNTGSQLKFTEFSTNGRPAAIAGGGFQPVNDAYEAAVETYLTTDGLLAQNPNSYDPGDGGADEEWTNWEAGLAPAVADPGDLVVFITDGQPNTVGVFSPPASSIGGAFDGEEVAAAGGALDELDAIKATGAHVLAIGVGAASNNANFDLLTRTVEAGAADVWEGVGELDLRSTDAIRVAGGFDALDNALRQVVFALCAPSVSVTKTNDAGAPIEGHAFAGTVDVTPENGGTDQFEWISPDLGLDPRISPPAAATQTAITDSNGVALFQWTPNTVADPQLWASTFTFTETLEPGWTLDTPLSQCEVKRLDSNGNVSELAADLVAVQNGQLVTFTLEVPNSNETFVLSKADIATCGVQNNRPGSITIVKDAVPNAAQPFGFSGSLGAFNLTDNGGTNSQTFPVPAGTYTVSENAPPAGWRFDTVTGAGCTATQNPREVSITVAPGASVTCTFVNKATARLVLAKEWLVAQQGDSATVTANLGGGAVEDSLQSTAGATMPQTDTDPTPLTIDLGSSVVLAETVNPSANYDSSLSCVDNKGGAAIANLTGTSADGRTETLTVAGGAAAVGATITCTFSNPRRGAEVVVVKQLVPETDPGRFDLRINGATVVPAAGDNVGNGADPVEVNINDQVTVTELPVAPAVAANYLTALVCGFPNGQGGTTAVSTDSNGTFTVPIAAADKTITCTFTNSRKSTDVTLRKVWVNGAPGDSTQLTVDPTLSPNGSGAAPAPGGGNGTVTPAGTTDVLAYAGDLVTLSESLAGDNDGSYTISSFSCNGGTTDQWSQNDPNLVLTVPASPTPITCTVTNTRTAKTFTLNKSWTDPVGGEVVGLDANGDDPAGDDPIDVNSISPTASTGNTMDVLSGETVTFSETFASAVAASNFTTTLTCNGEPVAFQSANGVVSASVAVDDYDGNITCAFANVRKSAQLVLSKNWVNGADNGAAANDSVTLAIDATNNGSDDATQVASTPDGGNGTSAATVSTTVYAGTTAELSETFGANTGTYNVTAFTCAPDATAAWTGSATDLDATVPITSAAIDAAVAGDGKIDCSITNTRRSATLTLTKVWVDAFDGDDVALSIDGIAADTPGSSTAPSTTTAATQTVFSGETVTLRETFGDGVASDGSGYTTTLVCGAAARPVTVPGGAADQRTGTYTVPASPANITCTFTNAGASDVTVEKDFVSAIDANFDGVYDVTYTVTVTNNGPAATSYSLTDTPDFDSDLVIQSASGSATGAPDPAGQDPWVGPSLTLATDQAIAGSNDPQDLVEHVYTLTFVVDANDVIGEDGEPYSICDPRDPEPGTGLFNLTTLTVDGVPADAQDCGNITPPNLTIVKSDPVVTGPNGDGEYTAVYTVTVTNNGPATQYALVDEPAFSPGLSIASGTATVTGGPPNPPAYVASPWTLAGTPGTPPGDDQPIAAATAHVFTLTFVVDGNDLLDGTADLVECDDEVPGPGEGLFNEATLTYAGTSVDDDGCGNPPIPDVSVDKTVVSVTDADLDGIYDVVYLIEVENSSTEPTTYDLTDVPNFDNDLTIVGTPTAIGANVTNPAAIAVDPYATPWDLVDDEPIAAGHVHQYTLTFRVDATGLIENPAATITGCTGEAGAADQGLFNNALLSYAGQDKADSACDVPDLPDLSITKSFVSATDADFDGVYAVTYTVTVTNSGDAPTLYDLADTPAFDADLVLLSGTASSVPASAIAPLTDPSTELPYVLATDRVIEAAGGADQHVYTLVFQVDATALIGPEGQPLTRCTDQDPNRLEALFNSASLTYLGDTITAEDCGEPPLPDLDVDKSVANLEGPDADGNYTVVYEITVTNDGDAPTQYDLSDTPGFDADLVIDSGTATSDIVGAPVIAPYAASPWTLATDQQIDQADGADNEHVYTLTFVVDGSAVLGDPTQLDPCSQDPASGEGLFNAALLTYVGGELPTDTCTTPDVPELTVDKDFVSATDGDLDGIYDVTYTVTVTNVSDVATTYDLDDGPSFDADLTIVSGSATASGGPAAPADFVASPWSLASGQAIAVDGVHVYTLVFEVDANDLIEPVSDPLPALDPCTGDDGEPGDALFNAATLTYNGQGRDAEDCGEPGLPDLSIDKSVASAVGPAADGTYTITYTIDVENEGDAPTEYDLSDTPDFDSDIVIVSGSAVASGGPSDPADYVTSPWTLATGESIAAGDTHTYTLTFVVDGTAIVADPDLLDPCTGRDGLPGEAFFNSALLTYLGDDLDDDACVTPGVPTIEVTKNVIDVPAQPVLVSDSTYTVTYDVDVNNVGTVDGAYTLTDVPAFDTGASITNIAIGGDATIPNYSSGDPIVTDKALPAGESDSYTVTVTFDVAPAMSAADRACSAEGGVKGEATYNLAAIVYNNGGTDDDHDCAPIPVPDISVTKVRTSDTATLVSGTTYEASYTVTVTNGSDDGPGVYTLADLPIVAGDDTPDVTITPDIDPTDEVTIEAGGEDIYTVTVRFDVPGDLSIEQRACVETRDESGTGAFNGVTVTWNDQQTSTSEDCVDIPNPNVDYDKVVVGGGAVFNGDDEWTVTYDVTVTNLDPVEGEAGPAEYDLIDTFDFGAGVKVDLVTVTTTPDDLPVVDGFDGDDQPLLADGTTIGGGATHTYRIAVDVTITPTEGINGDCRSEGGLNNIASLIVATDEGDVIVDEFDRLVAIDEVDVPSRTPVSACADFSTLTLIKVVDNGDGGNAGVGAFTLTAAQDDDVIISGTSPVAGSVPAGVYDLDETDVAGYTTAGFDCVGGEQEGDSVFVPVGANVECTIENDDEPVDLEVTKDDDGFVAQAGEPVPFEYTIEVTNLGPRELDDEPVTVVDTLPSAFRWVAPAPAGCAIAGQTLTCSVSPAALRPVGTTVTIVATARVAPGANAGIYDNRVTVTTQDDPVGQVPPCSDTGAIAENNNVDCEPTPVVSTISLEILTPVCVNDAPFIRYDIDAFGFVPSGSAKVTFFTLDGDFIETRNLTSLSGTTIYPGAAVDADGNPTDWPGWKFEGGLWVPDPTDNEWRDGVRAVFEVNPTAEGIVSYPAATTACADPTQVSADLAIEKTASVAQVGAGNSFTWTLDVENLGPDAATGVVVGDLVPASLTVTKVASSDFQCSRTGNDVSCTRASLAAGASGTIVITVSVPASAQAGTIVNVGTVESVTPDPDLTNNSDDASVVIVAIAPPAPPPPPPPATLPRTGSDATRDMVRAALMLLLLGAGAVLVTRRRRDAAASDA